VLGEPRVEQFAIDGLDPLYANRIAKVGSLLAEELFKDSTLYTFKPEDLRYAGTYFTLSKITTRPNGLVVTLDPVR
jgi:hypothetical protein